jgi:hypothetical protein
MSNGLTPFNTIPDRRGFYLKKMPGRLTKYPGT